MSDTPQGPGWWQASDGRYYPPQAPPGGPVGYSAIQPQTNTKATGSLICGIISLVCFGVVLGAVAIVLGVMARNEITASGGAQKGEGMAVAGIITGAVGALLTVVWLVWAYS